MTPPGVTRIKTWKCPECAAPLDAVGSPDRNDPAARPPQFGDPIACIRCGGVVMMGEDGNLRGFTDAEMDALVADTSTMNELAKLVRRIHVIRHMGS